MAYSDDIDALSPDHYWTMDNVTTDSGGSADNRPLQSTTFDATQIANDATYSLTLTSDSDFAYIADVDDINLTDLDIRVIGGWVQIATDPSGATSPICIYKEGGGLNNIALFIMEDGAFLGQCVSTTVGYKQSSIQLSDPLPIGRPVHLLARFSGSLQDNLFEFYVDGQTVDMVIGFDPNVETLVAHTSNIVWGDSYDTTLLYGAAPLATIGSEDALYSHWASWSSDSLSSSTIETELFGKGAVPYATVTNQTELDVYASSTISEKSCGILVNVSGSIELDFSSIVFSDNGCDVIYNGTGTLTINKQGTTDITRTLAINGGSIVVNEPATGIQFSSLVSGSQVVVYATGTTTERYRENSSGTSETYVASVQENIDYTILKVGYDPIRVTGYTVGATQSTVIVQQKEDRSYETSSGLTFGTNTSATPGTTTFTLDTASTLQNYHSHMMEEWIAQSSLRNVEYPIVPNGINSFTLKNGWEFDSGDVQYLSMDGMRYTDSAVTTAQWAAIFSVGEATGLQVNYQQQDGSGTTAAATTGPINELIQVYGDATHGSFDYTDHLVCKIQEDGYDQAEADVYDLYGTIEDQLYVIGLAPLSNGLATGDPSVSGVTITDHGASPVTWHSKDFSITITDSATPHTGTEIMRWLRYNFSLGGTFQSKDAFNWHDLVRENGTKFKTVRGVIYGDTGATLKGVRVVLNDGTTEHPDFDVFTSDDGTTYEPPPSITISNANLADNTRVQLLNTTADSGTAESGTSTTLTDTDKSWTINEWQYGYIKITSGTGNGVTMYPVASNTATEITILTSFDTTPDATSVYTLMSELDNSVVSGGGGYSYVSLVGTGEAIEVGDTIRMKSMYNSGSTYYEETDESAVATTSNMAMITEQENDSILNGYSIDGSAQTDFAVDYPNVQVDIDSGDTTRLKFLCWMAYITTTADGIRNFFGAITHQDAGNAVINVGVIDLHLDYVGTGNSKFIDTIWLRRSDGTNIFGGSGDNFYATSDKVYVVEKGVSGLTAAESAMLIDIYADTDALDTRIPASPALEATSQSISTAVAALQTTLDGLQDLSAAEVWAYLIETGFTAQDIMSIVGAAAAGKLSINDTTITIRNMKDTADIIIATVDTTTSERTEVIINVP